MVEKNWIKRTVLFASLLPCLFFGQKLDHKTFYIKSSAQFGFIIEHRNTMGHLVQSHIGGAELAFAVPSYGEHLWEHENNFPEKGAGVYWYTLGNKEQLGNIFAIAPHFEIPLKSKVTRSTMHMRLGAGLAFATKHFDPISNHKNNVISSPVNGFVVMKFLYKTDLSEKYGLEYGVTLAHASNGKASVPNLGVNIGALNLTMVFKSPQKGEVNFKTYTDSSSKRISKHELYWISSVGITTIYPVTSRKYLAQTHTLGYYLNVRNTHKWGGGIDIYYNPANKVNLLVEDSVAVSTEENVQFGVKLGWAYNIGRFSLPVEMGYYVKTRWKDEGLFYHRLGLRYYCKNNIVLQLGLKAHWARADYFEYGIGYRFPLKKK